MDVYVTDYRPLTKPRGTAIAQCDAEFEIQHLPKIGPYGADPPSLLRINNILIHVNPFRATMPRITYPRNGVIAFAEVVAFETPKQQRLFELSVLHSLQYGYADELPKELQISTEADHLPKWILGDEEKAA